MTGVKSSLGKVNQCIFKQLLLEVLQKILKSSVTVIASKGKWHHVTGAFPSCQKDLTELFFHLNNS